MMILNSCMEKWMISIFLFNSSNQMYDMIQYTTYEEYNRGKFSTTYNKLFLDDRGVQHFWKP